jgi:peptidoglycan hydrolase FlgJ
VGTTLNSPGNLSANTANNLAVDSHSLDRLRLQSRQEPDKALKLAAKQFETVFMNMMLKSMRDATPQDGMFDSEQTKMFTSMLDQQLAQNLGNRGVGLADMMVKQLSRQMPAVVPSVTPSALASPPAPGVSAGLPAAIKPAVRQNSATPAASGPVKSSLPSAYSESVQQDFVQRMQPHAAIASRETGLPAHQMIGQAALESGWGRRTIRMADGTDSHNLFGIKAGANWHGKVAEAKTTEFHNGVASKPTEKFRAYDSYADAFRDYARLLGDNERYAGVLKQGGDVHGFAQALQDSGYATDPRYAEKLVKVIGKVSTLA